MRRRWSRQGNLSRRLAGAFFTGNGAIQHPDTGDMRPARSELRILGWAGGTLFVTAGTTFVATPGALWGAAGRLTASVVRARFRRLRDFPPPGRRGRIRPHATGWS